MIVLVSAIIILILVYKFNPNKDLRNILHYIDFEIYNLKKGNLISKNLTSQDCSLNKIYLNTAILNLKQIIYEASLNGNFILEILTQFKSLLLDLENNLNYKYNLIKILCFKSIVSFGFAQGVRWLLIFNNKSIFISSDIFYKDIFALMLAWLVVVCSSLVIYKILPSLWLNCKGFSTENINWLLALFLNKYDKSFVLYDQINELKLKEIQNGVSLKKHITALILNWAYEKNSKFKNRLHEFENLLPLIELISIGITTTLIILIPIVEVL